MYHYNVAQKNYNQKTKTEFIGPYSGRYMLYEYDTVIQWEMFDYFKYITWGK